MRNNILFISFDPIEYRRRVLNQIETARKADFDVDVISTSKPVKISQNYNFKYAAIRLPSFIKQGMIAYPLFNFLLFFKILFKNYEVIHFRGIIPIPAILFRQWFTKSKLIYDAHEYFRGHLIFKHRPIRKAIWMWFEKQIVKQTETIITVCDPLAELLKKDYPNAKSVSVVHSVPNLNDNPPESNQDKKNDKLVVFHGYFLPGRALENTIKSMAYIKDPSIKLMLIGEGALESKLKKLVDELDLNPRIEFRPFIKNENLIEFISKASLGLVIIEPDCTNRKYALPNKFFECIHAGLPILASNIPTLQQYVDNYQVGMTVDPYNLQEIAKKIESILKDDNQLKRWHNNSQKAAIELNWDKEAEKLNQIYMGLF
jgi:glycosyltransferase involved in cell wall biosynthesis